jgi:G2/mitotic-specific cyclin 3/4
MLAIGGLKAAAKRTAFGDVSNTVKNLSPTHDDSVISGKNVSHDIVKQPLIPQEKSAAFLRPAQRPLNVNAVKGPLNSNSISNTSDSTSISGIAKASFAEVRQPKPQPQPPANKRTLSKRGTTIYKDTAGESDQPSQSSTSKSTRPDLAPTAPIHQNLGPRQHKSQPQLKPGQPVLRRSQSKYIGNVSEQSEVVVSTGSVYQEAQLVENTNEVYESYMRMISEKQEDQPAVEEAKPSREVVDRQHRQLPPPPLVSEPEEYWEEEEEEEIYDEQGYTTAHSYRSRGDNTTGGATTVLFPKVTNKAKKELAAAKEFVESSRTREEIEDEAWDTSMVAEYGDEIFQYMRELEVSPYTFSIVLAM